MWGVIENGSPPIHSLVRLALSTGRISEITKMKLLLFRLLQVSGQYKFYVQS